jgi:hypothetical protein
MQYVTMIRSINELKFLRGLDTGEKLGARDKIRATAGRVGLSVPRVSNAHDSLMLCLLAAIASRSRTQIQCDNTTHISHSSRCSDCVPFQFADDAFEVPLQELDEKKLSRKP